MSTKESTWITPNPKATYMAILSQACATLERGRELMAKDLDAEALVLLMKAQHFLDAFHKFYQGLTEDLSE